MFKKHIVFALIPLKRTLRKENLLT